MASQNTGAGGNFQYAGQRSRSYPARQVRSVRLENQRNEIRFIKLRNGAGENLVGFGTVQGVLPCFAPAALWREKLTGDRYAGASTPAGGRLSAASVGAASFATRALLYRNGSYDTVAAAAVGKRRVGLRNGGIDERQNTWRPQGLRTREPDKTILRSAPKQKVPRVRQRSSVVEREAHPISGSGNGDDAVGRAFGCGIADDEKIVIIVDEFYCGGQKPSHRCSTLTDKFCVGRLELGDKSSDLLGWRGNRGDTLLHVVVAAPYRRSERRDATTYEHAPRNGRKRREVCFIAAV